jgi:hypothetical protein
MEVDRLSRCERKPTRMGGILILVHLFCFFKWRGERKHDNKSTCDILTYIVYHMSYLIGRAHCLKLNVTNESIVAS